jgi:hypothetical protein
MICQTFPGAELCFAAFMYTRSRLKVIELSVAISAKRFKLWEFMI